MALEGNLKDIEITDLVHIYSSKERTCRITTKYGNLEGTIFFHEGNVIHASVGPLVGEEAFIQLLKWREGAFKIETDIDTDVEMPKVTIAEDTNELINKALERIEAGEEDEFLNTIKDNVMKVNGVDDVTTLSPSDLWVGKQIGKENFLATICTKAEIISNAMSLGEFKTIEMQGDTKNAFVYKLGGGYLLVWLKPEAITEKVKAKIEEVLY